MGQRKMFSACVPRCAHSTAEPLGQRMFKLFKFWATGRWIQRLTGRCERPMIEDETGRRKKQHVSCADDFIQKDTPNKPKRVGQLRYTGRKNNLKESGAYPLPLGQNLVQACLAGDAGLESLQAPRKQTGRMSGLAGERKNHQRKSSQSSSAAPHSWMSPTAGSARIEMSEPESSISLWAAPSAGSACGSSSSTEISSSWMSPPAGSARIETCEPEAPSSWMNPSP